jgi:hypothetical protein
MKSPVSDDVSAGCAGAPTASRHHEQIRRIVVTALSGTLAAMSRRLLAAEAPRRCLAAHRPDSDVILPLASGEPVG